MAKKYIKPGDVTPEDAQKVLVFLNSAKSAQEIDQAVEISDERDVGVKVGQRILDRRKELGKFTDMQQVADVPQVGPERFTELIITLCRRPVKMGKITVVSRERVETAQRRLEEKMAEDHRWKEEEEEFKRGFEEEKARRDAEYQSRKTETE